MRDRLLIAHRCVGLLLALFVTQAGLTGSIAAFHDSLDAVLNPDLFDARAAGPTLSPAALERRLAGQVPQAQLGYMLFDPPRGLSVRAYVQPRTDPATGKPFPLRRNEFFLDPATGTLLGGRDADGGCCSRRTLIPFLYRFHYTLALGTTGEWIMGLLSLLWSVDCLVGLALTLPPRRRQMLQGHRLRRRMAEWLTAWGRAWRVSPSRRGFRLTFDLHRAVSLWLWLVLLGIAFSGFSIALDGPVFRPAVTTLLPLARPPQLPTASAGAHPDLDSVVRLANETAAAQGWTSRAGAVFAMPELHMTGVYFFRTGSERGLGLGRPSVTIDTQTGRIREMEVPGRGRIGDLVMQLQFPWHSGQIAGLAGRILVACAGVATAGLAITGVMIWERKRRARASTRAHARQRARALEPQR